MKFRTGGSVCIYCGATPETRPERKFVTNGQFEICSTCIDEAAFVLTEKDRANPGATVASLEEYW